MHRYTARNQNVSDENKDWWLDALHAMQAVYMAKLGLKNSKVGVWTIAGIIAVATVLAVAAGYAVHRLRMRNVMQNEIRDIMYAPDSQTCLNLSGIWKSSSSVYKNPKPCGV